ncbi:unnamed protein product [Rotaria sp. Silwood1]|nr:unnamed protein product [Rotaria sp. Silwood1]
MDGKVNIQCVLFFDCDEQTCVARCLARGKASGRIDDNEQSLKKRIVTYNESTRPLIQLFEKDNLVKRIDASNHVDKVQSIKFFFVLNKNKFIEILGISRCSKCIEQYQINN